MDTKQVILLVDDEADVRKVLGQRLRTAGYQVIEAADGVAAVQAARQHVPNLILLDVVMPGIDGATVAQTLHDDPLTQGIPVIFLTALFTKQEEAAEGHCIGEGIFVAKPYDSRELLRLIQENIR
ncbi:MAG: response regulator [Candidatus Omnitrophica bacterium]|nr:response regulator [Candidatus Omnitrophota bacterium]